VPFCKLPRAEAEVLEARGRGAAGGSAAPISGGSRLCCFVEREKGGSGWVHFVTCFVDLEQR